MMVGDLIEALETYAEGQHVVIAMDVVRSAYAPGKYEVLDTWSDSVGCVNIVVGTPAGIVDPRMRAELASQEPDE